EDGIRDLIVTGVQTCALPICAVRDRGAGADAALAAVGGGAVVAVVARRAVRRGAPAAGPARTGIVVRAAVPVVARGPVQQRGIEIGRASCGKECRSGWWA